ncbi:MAG: J domain-containing protein [Nitrospira sp. SB0677_bin_15]|nr:J domain-containing protein [Nitrospira sp. SB0667_bin_9]MYD30687.1 J domain-containing protein [Nitrospira sp. SB0661_bin_20]MYG41080.1 J domain-containing protein [Nitrospira sp. SB0677_bin_15]MYH01798.1 J domain-containing protein [Nitrospira sp. SB0675_bin_23]MYJ23452.1 J domain-containing protein [Nitrospira sp. SB0673_bin_12]
MARIHLDYYATLEVTPQASDEEIKRAYRKLALKYHPDRNQGNKQAEEKIREINAAYEVLGDPETRKSYERLRFGGHGQKSDFAEEPTETANPGVVLEAMEKKLWEEGRLEIFRSLMQDLPMVKRELADIRKTTVAKFGYDKFHEETVKMHATHAVGNIVTPGMDERKDRLLDVALHMMLSQGVDGRGGREGTEWVKRQLAASFDLGRVDGYCEACELLYVRR